MAAPAKIVLVLVTAAGVLAGCQPMHQDASLQVGGKAEPHARTWADPGSQRPDLPPDRDGGKD